MQMVRCYVLDQVSKNEDSASAKKVIRLSMRASLINRGLSMKHISAGFPLYGCIQSKEDNGYGEQNDLPCWYGTSLTLSCS
jgi:hypothetical protein